MQVRVGDSSAARWAPRYCSVCRALQHRVSAERKRAGCKVNMHGLRRAVDSGELYMLARDIRLELPEDLRLPPGAPAQIGLPVTQSRAEPNGGCDALAGDLGGGAAPGDHTAPSEMPQRSAERSEHVLAPGAATGHPKTQAAGGGSGAVGSVGEPAAVDRQLAATGAQCAGEPP